MDILIWAVIGAVVLVALLLLYYRTRQSPRTGEVVDVDQQQPIEPYREAPPGETHGRLDEDDAEFRERYREQGRGRGARARRRRQKSRR